MPEAQAGGQREQTEDRAATVRERKNTRPNRNRKGADRFMPVEKESKLGQWIAALREGWPAIRAGVDEWTDAVRENPALIWATPAVRYTVYGLGGLLALWLVTWGVGQFQPPEAAPPAATAESREPKGKKTSRKRSTKQETLWKTQAAILHKAEHPAASDADCAKAVGMPVTTLTGRTEWREWVIKIEKAAASGRLPDVKKAIDKATGDLIPIIEDNTT